MSNSHSLSPLLSAVGLFLVVAAICTAVVGIAYADMSYLGALHHRSEASLVEIAQSVIMIGISVAFFIAAARHSGFRGGFILAGGLFLTMFIRENDGWLDAIRQGFWLPVALVAMAACLAAAWRYRASVRDGLLFLCDPRTILLAAVAMALLLVFSRLFGCKAIWNAAGVFQTHTAVKTIAEETLELLADALLALWAILVFRLLPPARTRS